MIQLKIIICAAICLLGIIKYTYAADKYTDENRPYEFGFTIDGEQHRHEKKDENGIIMGEFGFITADGVYHVTVYATDEQGRFKILSMKNIRVKPYPTAAGSGGVKKGHSLPFPPSQNAPVLQGPQAQKEMKPVKPLLSSPANSCSHCSLPTTTTKAPQLSDIAVVATDLQVPYGPGLTATQPGLAPQSNPQYQQNYPQQSQASANAGLGGLQPQNSPQNIPQTGFPADQTHPQDQQIYNSDKSIPQQQSGTNEYNPQNTRPGNDNYYPQQGNAYPNNYPQQQSDVYQNNYPQQDGSKDGNYPQQITSLNQPQSPQTTGSEQNYPGAATGNQQPPNAQDNNSRNPKQYNEISPISVTGSNQPQGIQNADKPTLLAAQMQIVPKETDIHHREPGEQEGLPVGVSKDDVTQLLYTFNYTVGFHGHHEKGYTNGAKQGYYYVTGRNGIRTRVDYVADEKGFRPRISQVALDLLSDDVPKPETEKDEKFGLKGYEFKWLYYPADEKPQ